MKRNALDQVIKHCCLVAALSIAALLQPGCGVLPGVAINNRENTPVTNTVEEKLSAASPNAQKALLPLVWPLAAATLTVDALVVHPVSVVDDAHDDTRELLWEEFEWEDQYATECFKLPWRAIFTPIVFGFDFLGRAIFDLEPHGHKDAARAQADQGLAKARALADRTLGETTKTLEEGGSRKVHAVLDEIPIDDIAKLTLSQKGRYYALRLRAAHAAGDYAWFLRLDGGHRRNLSAPTVRDALAPIIEQMLSSEDPFTRLTAFQFARAWLRSRTQHDYALRQLSDPDPMIRFELLNAATGYVESRSSPDFMPEARAVIARMAGDDPNPIIRARAAELDR